MESVRCKKNRSGHSFYPNINRAKGVNLKKGFSLIEMLVSVAIFSMVMIAVTATLLSSVNANRKVQGLKSSIDSVSLAIESMTRSLRTGSSYVIGGVAGNCASPGQTGISFSDSAGTAITYVLTNGYIQFSKAASALANMTSSDVTIDRLCFYVNGTGNKTSGNFVQPTVLVVVGGYVSANTAPGAKAKTSSRFDLQTLVTQRIMDNQ